MRPAWGVRASYKALSSEGNPELVTVLKVVRALGLGKVPSGKVPAVWREDTPLPSGARHASSYDTDILFFLQSAAPPPSCAAFSRSPSHCPPQSTPDRGHRAPHEADLSPHRSGRTASSQQNWGGGGAGGRQPPTNGKGGMRVACPGSTDTIGRVEVVTDASALLSVVFARSSMRRKAPLWLFPWPCPFEIGNALIAMSKRSRIREETILPACAAG